MKIFINDVPVSCPEDITLQEVLQNQSIPLVNIAVAIDNAVIPKTQWEKTIVQEGNNILIIKAVQGG